MARRRGMNHRVRTYLQEHGPAITAEIAEALGVEARLVQNALHGLKGLGHVERLDETAPRQHPRGAVPHPWRFVPS